MPKLLVYSEEPDLTLELINITSFGITDAQVSVALLGARDLDDAGKKVSVNGVNSIFEIQSEALKDFGPEAVTDALEAISLENKPDFVLISATKKGREVAPKLAVRLNLGCITDAQNLKFENGSVRAERVVWGGNAISTVASKNGAVITIAPRAGEKAGGSSQPEIKKISFQPKTRTSIVLGNKPKESGEVNLKDADAVVSAGRGFKKKEDLTLLNELATTLHAVIGASRPLTSDLGWMPESRQVGLSGTTVKPKLYVAVGISGQIQHLTGMRDSKLIVAINNDKNAPIFQECDYGIVGDLYQVIPALTKALKSKTGH
jgi:electron transfer flavoprotein alpha subunit